MPSYVTWIDSVFTLPQSLGELDTVANSLTPYRFVINNSVPDSATLEARLGYDYTSRSDYQYFYLHSGDTVNTWDGVTWSKGHAPNGQEHARLRGDYTTGTNGKLTCGVLEIEAEVTLHVTGESAQIMGDLINHGSILQTDSAVILGGTATQTISGHTTLLHLQIDNSAGVVIGDSTDLTILRHLHLEHGELVTDTSSRLILEATIDQTTEVTVGDGVVSGSYVIARQFIQGNYDGTAYRHISSPVAGVTYDQLSGSGFSLDLSNGAAFNANPDDPSIASRYPNLFIYQPEEATSSISQGWKCPESTDAISSGLGMSLSVDRSIRHENTPIELMGELHDGQILVPITNPFASPSSNHLGWNLLGNPYPSALDVAAFLEDNTAKIDGAAYIFRSATSDGGGYAVRTAGGVSIGDFGAHIAPFQAFFVRSSLESGTVAFQNSQRPSAYTAPTHFRTEDGLDEKYQGILKLTLTPKNHQDRAAEAVLVLHPDGTQGKDTGHEAALLQQHPTGWPTLYFHQQENSQNANLVIKCLPPAAEDVDIVEPLIFTVDQDGEYILEATEINQLIDGATIVIEDIKTGTTQDLTQNPTYTFTAESDIQGTRLAIHIKGTFPSTTALPHSTTPAPVHAYISDQQLHITLPENTPLSTIQVLDISGRQLAYHRPSLATTLQLPIGRASMVIIRVTNQHGVIVKKVGKR